MNSANAALWSQFEDQSIENTYRLNRLIGVGGFAGVFDADHVWKAALCAAWPLS